MKEAVIFDSDEPEVRIRFYTHENQHLFRGQRTVFVTHTIFLFANVRVRERIAMACARLTKSSQRSKTAEGSWLIHDGYFG